jgi:hypothetical protein
VGEPCRDLPDSISALSSDEDASRAAVLRISMPCTRRMDSGISRPVYGALRFVTLWVVRGPGVSGRAVSFFLPKLTASGEQNHCGRCTSKPQRDRGGLETNFFRLFFSSGDASSLTQAFVFWNLTRLY